MLCPICQRPESEAQKFWNHYGNVKCCLSCKAFFRRYLKESKKKKLCRFQNNCNLHYSIRKNKCSWCRYQKCLSVGMRHDYVLDCHRETNPLSNLTFSDRQQSKLHFYIWTSYSLVSPFNIHPYKFFRSSTTIRTKYHHFVSKYFFHLSFHMFEFSTGWIICIKIVWVP